MDLATQERGGVLVVAAKGDLNAASCGQLEQELAARVDAGWRRLVLDLGEVRYVSSAGLRVFLLAARKVGTEGRFVLARPVEAVRGVLEMTGFLGIIKVEADLEAAVAAAEA
jgi:anti-anti-sigma factor